MKDYRLGWRECTRAARLLRFGRFVDRHPFDGAGTGDVKSMEEGLDQESNHELILHYFRAQKLLSRGVVEGLNNKPKVTMRKSYGFRTFRTLELALYHSLGKLPEAESTHDFF